MTQNLSCAKIRVPNGFALTTVAYERFLQNNAIRETIANLIRNVSPDNLSSLANTSSLIKQTINRASFDKDSVQLIRNYYEELKMGQKQFRVAVRSSASAEDLPTASFAGQQDTYLHVASFDEVMMRIKDVYASLFSERAIAYRSHNGFTHEFVLMAVGI